MNWRQILAWETQEEQPRRRNIRNPDQEELEARRNSGDASIHEFHVGTSTDFYETLIIYAETEDQAYDLAHDGIGTSTGRGWGERRVFSIEDQDTGEYIPYDD